MRFIGLVFALLAALCLAQSQQNYINVPVGNFNAVAGQPITITWSNPSSGSVTIRLSQSGSSDGPVLVSGIPASAETATFTIPSNVNAAAYNFAIVDDSNRNNINFSSAFTISGGTDTPSASASATASATASSATASATASLSSLSSSASSARSSMSASASSMSASASSAASSASASASSAASRMSSSASSSASAAATSVAASTNGCAAFGISGAAAVLAAVLAVY